MLADQLGRMTPERMLLMAGLMLSDKTVGLEEDLRRCEAELKTQQKYGRAAARPACARTRADRGSDDPAFGARGTCRIGGTSGICRRRGRSQGARDHLKRLHLDPLRTSQPA